MRRKLVEKYCYEKGSVCGGERWVWEENVEEYVSTINECKHCKQGGKSQHLTQ